MKNAGNWLVLSAPVFLGVAGTLVILTLYSLDIFRPRLKNIPAFTPPAAFPIRMESLDYHGRLKRDANPASLDPFGIEEQIAARSPVPEVTVSGLALSLVALSGTDGYCILNGIVYREGEGPAGIRIRDISSEGVMIDTTYGTFFLRPGERKMITRDASADEGK